MATDITQINLLDDEDTQDEVSGLTDAQRELLAKVRDTEGPDAFKSIAPLALHVSIADGYSTDDATMLFEKSVIVKPVVNPVFDATLLGLGAKRQGSRTYNVSVSENGIKESRLGRDTLKLIIKALPMDVVYSAESEKKGDTEGFHEVKRLPFAHQASVHFCNSKMGEALDQDDLIDSLYREHASGQPFASAAIVARLRKDGSRLSLKVVTTRPKNRDELVLPGASVDLNVMRASGLREPAAILPDEAVNLIAAARDAGWPIADSDGVIDALTALVRRATVAGRMPGSPGLARLVIGAEASRPVDAEGAVMTLPEYKVGNTDTAAHAAFIECAVKDAGAAIDAAREENELAALDPYIVDIVRMEAAADSEVGREGLRHYQDQAVSLHVATEVGYVNATSRGMGKTVMALAAMREKHLLNPEKPYVALVTMSPAIRTQWRKETEKFFPEANVVVVENSDFAEKFAEVEKAAQTGGATVVIASYSTLTANADGIEVVEFDDFIVDEAAILKNPGSKRTKAIWQLRDSAKVAVALTGTPIVHSVDDLGRLVSWVRNDPDMFTAKMRLSNRHPNVAAEGAVSSLWSALGPTVFRRDRSELQDELPDVNVIPIIVTPEPAERELAEAARRDAKKLMDEFDGIVDEISSLDPSNPDYEAKQQERARRQGVAVSGVVTARQAASDALALEGSKSALVELLRKKGLVQKAIDQGGTKRDLLIQMITEIREEEAQSAILVFTDFPTVGKRIAADLTALGVTCGTFFGGESQKNKDKAIEDYQNGQIDVLVLGRSAREGLNLQRTTHLFNFDLPWNPDELIQRIGRADRIGAGRKKLTVFNMMVEGTIEERVAAVIVTRAMTSLMVLDTSRGVDARSTDTGMAIGGLHTAVSEDEQGGDTGLFAVARNALGEF